MIRIPLILLMATTLYAQLVIGVTPPAPTVGTFTLMQTASCSPAVAANNCIMTFPSALTAGNLDIFSCYVTTAVPPAPAAISTVLGPAGAILGTLVLAYGASTAGSNVNTLNISPSLAYILPSTSVGGGPAVTVTLTNNNNLASAGSFCYGAELYPSAAGANVGLDVAGSFMAPGPTGSPTDMNVTLSGTDDAGLVAVSNTVNNAGIWPTMVSMPQASGLNAYLPGAQYSGVAIAPMVTNGNGAMWTMNLATGTPAMQRAFFGWNVTPCKDVILLNFEGGTNGANVAAATLGPLGWRGGQWVVSDTPPLITFDTTANQPFLTTLRTCGDGMTYTGGTGSLGMTVSADTVIGRHYIEYRWQPSGPAKTMTCGAWLWTDIAPPDTLTISPDVFVIIAPGVNVVAAARYTITGSNFFMRFYGGGVAAAGDIPIQPNTWYWVVITLGTSTPPAVMDSLQVYGCASGSPPCSSLSEVGSVSVASTNASYPESINLGAPVRINAQMPPGRHVKFDSLKCTLDGAAPGMQP